MKCPSCHAMCAAGDPKCYSCGTPIGHAPAAGRGGEGEGGGGVMSRLPKVLAAVGTCIGMVAGPAILGNPKAPPKKGIDMKKAMYAGVGGGTCAMIGAMIGTVLAGSRRYD